MKQMTVSELIAEAALHSNGNRREIEASKYAGCLSCCAVFDAKSIVEWKDEWTSAEKQNRIKRWTAICPECGNPTVIGSYSGLLDNQYYLPAMKAIFAK